MSCMHPGWYKYDLLHSRYAQTDGWNGLSTPGLPLGSIGLLFCDGVASAHTWREGPDHAHPHRHEPGSSAPPPAVLPRAQFPFAKLDELATALSPMHAAQ